MFSGVPQEIGGVLFEQVALLDEVERRRCLLADVLVAVAVALLDR